MPEPTIQSDVAPAGASAPVPRLPRVPNWLLAAMLTLTTIAVYWPATRYDFINFDDPAYVTANPQVQGGLTWDSVKWAFLSPVSANWHPLTIMSHMLDCQLFGLNPWGHHLVNVLLHALNAALVFLLLQQLTSAVWRSLAVAALFAAHPLHVESVAWIAERKDVLSGCFGLLSLIFYVRYAQKRSRVEGPESSAGTAVSSLVTRHSSLDYVGALFFLALGFMSKPMLVTWPFVMLLLDYWPLGRLRTKDYGPQTSRSLSSLVTRHSSLLVEKLPFFALAAVASFVTFVVQKQGGSLMATGAMPLDSRVENVPISYCRYLEKLFWPRDLAVFYPHPGYWPVGRVLLAGLLLVGIAVFVLNNRRRCPFLLMGWLWYCGTLVPMIGLVQTGGQAMADRHTYIASLGIMILAVWGVHALTRRWRHRLITLSVAGLTVTVACLALTRHQLEYWRDSETLFQHALAVTENNYLAHNNLGDALERKGQTDEAIRQYQEAIHLRPTYADAHYNLGNVLYKKGQTDEAIRQFQDYLRLKPDNIDAHYNLGAAFYQKGRMDEAVNQFQEVIRLKANYAEAHYCLGMALGARGQMDEATRQFQEVIRLKPDYADAYNKLAIALDRAGQTDNAIVQYQEYLRFRPDDGDARYNLAKALARRGRITDAVSQFREVIRLEPGNPDAHDDLGDALIASGRLDEAIENYRRALQTDPNRPQTLYRLGLALGQLGRTEEAIDAYRAALKLNPSLAPVLNNLAWALATSSNAQLRNGAEAVQLAERACELTHHTQPWFVGTLAAAYAEAGRFPDAAAMAEKAEQLAATAGAKKLAEQDRQLLELYRAGKPYHEPAPTAQK